jgi:hypothetical protein
VSQKIDQEIEDAVAEYERLIGRPATATRAMMSRYESTELLSRLVRESKIQQGLKVLAKANRLDLSFEAIVVRHRDHPKLKREVPAAEWRLERARRGDFD